MKDPNLPDDITADEEFAKLNAIPDTELPPPPELPKPPEALTFPKGPQPDGGMDASSGPNPFTGGTQSPQAPQVQIGQDISENGNEILARILDEVRQMHDLLRSTFQSQT